MLHEKLTWVSVTAMIVILAGVALVQTAGLRSKRKVSMLTSPGIRAQKNAA